MSIATTVWIPILIAPILLLTSCDYKTVTIQQSDTESPTLTIKPGQIYEWVSALDKRDPFGKSSHVTVTVLEVRDGWVRYRAGTKEHCVFCDEHMSVDGFLGDAERRQVESDK